MPRQTRAIAGGLHDASQSCAGRPRLFRKAGVAAVLTLLFVWILFQRIKGVTAQDVLLVVAAVPATGWIGALGATVVSFWAVGRYDETAHRHLASPVPPRQARMAGVCAIALSQVLGLGVVTGSLVRWRMLPSLNAWAAGRLTLLVSAMFLAGWAVVTAAVVLALGGPGRPLAVMVLAGALMAAVVPLVGGLRGWPNLYTLARMVALAAVDCGGAALAMWCLWAGDASLAQVFPAVLIALGAGLLSGAPGGIGAFELVLLALLPGQDPAAVLASVLAWRGVYFGLPAVFAGAVVLRGPKAARRVDVAALVSGTPVFPEAGLMRQGRFQPVIAGGVMFAAARTPHALVALREPLAGKGGAMQLRALAIRANREARIGVVYKAPPRLAARARRVRMAVLPLAREAWLDPRAFAVESAARAGLRRKLRKAAQAGVLAQCDMASSGDLARLNADWVTARGREQGFSMGRFDPEYLTHQRVYIARIGPRPVGFASFHIGASGWALDLLRPHPDAPEGTAHALIAAALADAGRADVARLSLAAVPEPAFGSGGVMAAVMRARPGQMAAAFGLWQFKQSFAPRWERLYLIAPSWAGLALAAWDIRSAVRRPGPLALTAGQTLSLLRASQESGALEEENEIASRPVAWHSNRN